MLSRAAHCHCNCHVPQVNFDPLAEDLVDLGTKILEKGELIYLYMIV